MTAKSQDDGTFSQSLMIWQTVEIQAALADQFHFDSDEEQAGIIRIFRSDEESLHGYAWPLPRGCASEPDGLQIDNSMTFKTAGKTASN